MYLTLEPTYAELHSHLYKSDAQKAIEKEWQDGFNAYLKFDAYDFNASPEWQEGYQQSWREINCINVNLDPNGTYTDIAWQGFLELGGKA